jgi:hypothetical protein
LHRIPRRTAGHGRAPRDWQDLRCDRARAPARASHALHVGQARIENRVCEIGKRVVIAGRQCAGARPEHRSAAGRGARPGGRPDHRGPARRNTGAEGRLTRGDAITYARTKIQPDELFDVATLFAPAGSRSGPAPPG